MTTRYCAVFHLEFSADPEKFEEEAEIIAKSFGGDSYVDGNTILLAEEPNVSCTNSLNR